MKDFLCPVYVRDLSVFHEQPDLAVLHRRQNVAHDLKDFLQCHQHPPHGS